MIMLMRFLILPIILIQAWLNLKQGSGTMAASLTACDLAVDLIILGSIWLHVKLEIPTKQTLNSDEINAET